MRFYPPLAMKLKLSGATKIISALNKALELQGRRAPGSSGAA